ncbi:hypothetical protein AB0F59_26350 [Micromonospora lupini]
MSQGEAQRLDPASSPLPGRLAPQEPHKQPPAGSDTSLAGAEKRA